MICCKETRSVVHHRSAPPPLIQVATVTIDSNKSASITAVGGAEFEVDDGIFPVQMSPTGRRLLVRRQQRPACPLQRLSGGLRVPLAA